MDAGQSGTGGVTKPSLLVQLETSTGDEYGERKMQIQKKNTITPQELQQDFQKVNRRQLGRNFPSERLSETVQIQKIQLYWRWQTLGLSEFLNVTNLYQQK